MTAYEEEIQRLKAEKERVMREQQAEKERVRKLEEENASLKATIQRHNQVYEERLRELERCTGINPSLSPLASSFLRDKDFT